MTLARALRQTLESLKRAGVEELPRPEVRCWTLPPLVQVSEQVATPVRAVPAATAAVTAATPEKRDIPQPVTENIPVVERPRPVTLSPEKIPVSPPLQTAAPPAVVRPMTIYSPAEHALRSAQNFMKAPSRKQVERETCLAALAQKVAQCTRCPELARTRTQTVFGTGNPMAEVMFIGEAPGADEDKQGEPFVGRAGQLLNKIIGACGWTREELYICNILRCRPPGNRNPTPVEADHCREYLDGQIETVNPRYIVCWGTIAAQNLLGNTTPIGRLRGQMFQYGKAKVLCTYHPSYLLRNPSAKKHVWDDLKILLREMGIDPEQLNKS